MKSKGEVDLYDILKAEFPYVHIIPQYAISVPGNRRPLFIDYYIPRYKIAVEYDGVQHEKFSAFFHGTQENFNRGKHLDRLKEQWCIDRGATLLRINYKESVSVKTLRAKIHQVLEERVSRATRK